MKQERNILNKHLKDDQVGISTTNILGIEALRAVWGLCGYAPYSVSADAWHYVYRDNKYTIKIDMNKRRFVVFSDDEPNIERECALYSPGVNIVGIMREVAWKREAMVRQ